VNDERFSSCTADVVVRVPAISFWIGFVAMMIFVQIGMKHNVAIGINVRGHSGDDVWIILQRTRQPWSEPCYHPTCTCLEVPSHMLRCLSVPDEFAVST
jgi:hypothetical protein